MATTSQQAPTVQTIGDIVKELNPAFQPGIDLAKEEMALIEPQLQADIAGAEQAKINEFRNITNIANRRGMTFSGIPIGEQARYIGEKFLPAVQQLKTGAQKERIRIRDIIAGIQRDSYLQAFGERGKQQDRLFDFTSAEANREFSQSERIAGQEYATSERIASQNFQSELAAQAARASAASRSGSSSDPKVSEWQHVAGGVSEMATMISSDPDLTYKNAEGKTGYLSPESYTGYKSQWMQAGLRGDYFDQNFSYLANPQHKQDYGLGD